MSLQSKSIRIGRFTLTASRAYPNNRIVWHVADFTPGANWGPGMTKKEAKQFLTSVA